MQAYGLRRLARGLGSSREGARQGFAAAFASLLAVADGLLDVDGAVALLEGCLEITNSMKASVSSTQN